MGNLATTAPDKTQTQPIPLVALIILSTIGFVTMLTETVPAGLLSGIGGSLSTSPATTGQLLTVYATASMIAAVPLTGLTRTLPRKPLLIATVVGVALANVVTAASGIYWLTFLARILAGICAGIQWAMIAGYAMRITADPAKKGKALSVSMAGIPLALAVGVPVGTFLGGLVGWRGAFVALTIIGLAAAAAATARLPHLHAEIATTAASTGKPTLMSALRSPGVLVIALCAFAFQAGHMNLYTYVEPYLRLSGLQGNITLVLLVLGVAAISGLWITGVVIDRHIRILGLAVAGVFTVAMIALSVWSSSSVIVAIAIACWGLALGAAPTLFQAAAARAAGSAIDIVQAILVTLFNAGMATGSAIGGAVLAGSSANALPWVSSLLFIALLTALILFRRTALPPVPSRICSNSEE